MLQSNWEEVLEKALFHEIDRPGLRGIFKRYTTKVRCETCCPQGEDLEFPGGALLHRLANSDDRWPQSMCHLFGTLLFHLRNEEDKLFLDCNQELTTPVELTAEKRNKIQYICSIAGDGLHFGLICLVAPQKEVHIMDGKKEWNWDRNIDLLLSRLGQDLNQWTTVEYIDPGFTQNDDCSCGPLACAMLWNLFYPGQEAIKIPKDVNHAVNGWELRNNVVNKLLGMMVKFEGELCWKLGPQNNENQTEESKESDGDRKPAAT